MPPSLSPLGDLPPPHAMTHAVLCLLPYSGHRRRYSAYSSRYSTSYVPKASRDLKATDGQYQMAVKSHKQRRPCVCCRHSEWSRDRAVRLGIYSSMVGAGTRGTCTDHIHLPEHRGTSLLLYLHKRFSYANPVSLRSAGKGHRTILPHLSKMVQD